MNMQSSNYSKTPAIVPGELVHNEERQPPNSSILARWYRLAGPPAPPVTANLIQRETYRRGQLASLVLLTMILLILAFAGEAIKQPSILITLGIILCINFVALVLNRRGLVTVVALLIIFEIELAAASVIGVFSPSSSLNIPGVAEADLLLATVIVTAILLPAWSVFVVSFLNIAIICGSVLFKPHAPDLAQYIATDGFYNVVARQVLLELVVAAATYAWGSSMLKALKRADRAEAMATLQRALVQQQHIAVQQKEQLERSIEYIVETQTRVANGDFSARVPLTQDNVLWQVAGSFNNLLARFQQVRKEEYELQKLRNEMAQFVNAMREAKATNQPLRFARTGTMLDVLAAEFNRDRDPNRQNSSSSQKR